MSQQVQSRKGLFTRLTKNTSNPLKYLGLVVVVAGAVTAATLPDPVDNSVPKGNGQSIESSLHESFFPGYEPGSVYAQVEKGKTGLQSAIATAAENKAAREEAERVAAEQAAAAAEAARIAAEQEAARIAAEQAAAEEAARVAAEQEAQRVAAEERSRQEREAVSRSATRSDPSGAKAIAAQMVSERGWNASEFTCLEKLWEKESNWNHTAKNPSSGAYGIPQSLPGNKMASAGSDWQTNPATQITWGLGYIADRYGSPCGAWSASQAKGWY